MALFAAMGYACGSMMGASHSPSRGLKSLASFMPYRVGGSLEVLRIRGGGITQLQAEEVVRCDNLLGEAPMWHEEQKALYWLDINGKKMCRYHPNSQDYKSWDLPEVAGSFAFTKSGGFLMGFASGLSWYNLETSERRLICPYEEGLPTRPNDGKCDREGNFVIGSYNNNHRQDKKNIAGLWRLNAQTLELEEILDYRFRCSNTIAFSAEGDKMYFCDTPTQEIFRFDYSPNDKLRNKVSFWKMSEDEKGGPDGATVDNQGGLWEAQAGNWKVVRHRPEDGAVDYEINLPFNNPTSCAIGDGVLYITTARHRLSEEERKEQPGAGQLWAVKLPEGVSGVPEPCFLADCPI
ncbi:hypothetical protein GUITHDRAFT_147780 [Guillardia theta CCMP2712]|uniref:SMP-30/Gluconolactonase/LRE-like region domain-containing protein n=1 Tax=Guillardia theta (strain CCMP2712) TaxID=905079 RepID=L1ICE4_GUITC|nr:hypothetical protein GUITHDRAFT_147780 [Guillardia theta CCMP2712]EKX33599.1 hypothetical protein GUITHDRAFT_147780 [Guillardia theta CCMP2712]|eukprot:XP_005820579.1 hypothetical protein GUITHDRAFT_147780 [Guillardia theta CCMP2712]